MEMDKELEKINTAAEAKQLAELNKANLCKQTEKIAQLEKNMEEIQANLVKFETHIDKILEILKELPEE